MKPNERLEDIDDEELLEEERKEIDFYRKSSVLLYNQRRRSERTKSPHSILEPNVKKKLNGNARRYLTNVYHHKRFINTFMEEELREFLEDFENEFSINYREGISTLTNIIPRNLLANLSMSVQEAPDYDGLCVGAQILDLYEDLDTQSFKSD